MNATATPLRDRRIELHDGRQLAYAEWGEPGGRPVVVYYGGSRLFCPDVHATRAAGVRLITIDRPGYGRSDPHPGRTFHDCVADLEELADRLHLTLCPVVGWSGGGPWALALAVHAPTRVTSVGLVAVPIPIDEAPSAWDALSDDARALFDLVHRDPDAAIDGLRRRYRSSPAEAEAMVAGWGIDQTDPDFAVDSRPDVHAAEIEWFRESARQLGAGDVEDALTMFGPWGFSPAEVSQPAHIWWGEADSYALPAAGRWLVAAMPRATLVTYPGEGHMVPVSHWAEILNALV